MALALIALGGATVGVLGIVSYLPPLAGGFGGAVTTLSCLAIFVVCSKTPSPPSDNILHYSGALTAKAIPFDQRFFINAEKLPQLCIRATGKSDLAEFNDSIFEMEFQNPNYILIRRKFQETTVHLPTFTKEKNVPFTIFNLTLQRAWKTDQCLMHAMSQLPDEILGSGAIGQVYKVNFEGKPLVIKIERAPLNVREGIRFILKD